MLEEVESALTALKRRGIRINHDYCEYNEDYKKEYDVNYIIRHTDQYSLRNLQLAIEELYYIISNGYEYIKEMLACDLYDKLIEYRCEQKRPFIDITVGLFVIAINLIGYPIRLSDVHCDSIWCDHDNCENDVYYFIDIQKLKSYICYNLDDE